MGVARSGISGRNECNLAWDLCLSKMMNVKSGLADMLIGEFRVSPRSSSAFSAVSNLESWIQAIETQRTQRTQRRGSAAVGPRMDANGRE